MSTPLSGGYCGGVPPLPIPNREVKPACADGTAMQCGRVGGRLLFERESPGEKSPGLFSFFDIQRKMVFLCVRVEMHWRMMQKQPKWLLVNRNLYDDTLIIQPLLVRSYQMVSYDAEKQLELYKKI